ncbi:MAG: HAMP domain-containing histidine kinase [Chloroflexi bacterium]|nr:HAMP domain-containing histidine kinase [Chloroflexota bacterium]
MHRLSWHNLPLASKLTLAITLLVVLAVTSVTLLAIQREQSDFRDDMEDEAVLLLNILAFTSSDAIYNLNIDRLQDIMEELGRSEKVIVAGRFYDNEGRIIADGIRKATTFQFDPDPFGKQLVNSDGITFHWKEDQLLAGKAVVIQNQIFGAVSIGLPTAPLVAKTETMRQQGLAIAAIIIIVGAILALLISRSITVPLSQVATASQRIAHGDFTQRISVQGNDEIAALANAFNQMSLSLQENEVLKQANHFKSELISIAAHDLKNPLTTVIGFADLLRDSVGSPTEQKEMIAHILDSTRRMLNIVKRLLQNAALENGHVTLNRAPIDAAVLVETIKERRELQALRKSQQLVFEITQNVVVDIDEDRMLESFDNLVENAIKYSPSGATINVSLKCSEGTARFEVRDEGQGLSRDDMGKIFGKFQRLSSVPTDGESSTGLGLSIAKQLVETHGGKVFAESDGKGRGSVFVIELPLVKNESSYRN